MIPVEYELDKFNTPHTGTTLRQPQNWLCRLRCRILLWHLTTSPLGNIFWRYSRFSPKQPELQNSRWLQRFSPQTANTTFAKPWRTYLPRASNNTRCFLYHNFESFPCFFSYYETFSINVNSLFDAAIKNLHVKANGIFVFLLLHPSLLTTTISEGITHTRKTTFLRLKQ